MERTTRRYKFCRVCKEISPLTRPEQQSRQARCKNCGSEIRLSGVSTAAQILRFVGNVTTGRRQLLKGIAIGGAAAAGGLASGITIFQFLRDAFGDRLDTERTEREQRHRQYPNLRDIEFEFSETFGLVGPIQSLSLGRDDYPKVFHIDNLAAGVALAGPLGLYAANPITTDGGIDALPDGDLVLIGGPNSTPLTKIAWEFEGPNDRELRRRDNPVIPLTFYGISDSKGLERVAWKMEDQGNRASYNWPFVCTDENRPYRELRPEYDETRRLPVEWDGRMEEVPTLRNNYLLVTRIPNFLAPNFAETVKTTAREDWPYLTVFEGNHGVGTRGVALLLTAEGLASLEKLKHSLRGIAAFQQMFRVGDIALTPGDFHKPYSIELFDDVAPLDLSESVYLQAHDYAMRRLGPEAASA